MRGGLAKLPGVVRFGVFDPTGITQKRSESVGIYTDGEWHHLVVISDNSVASNRPRIIVDGVENFTVTVDNGSVPTG